MKKVYVLGFVLAFSLVLIIFFQQYYIIQLHEQNKDMAVSVAEKNNAYDGLMNQYTDLLNGYSQLNLSYIQLLSNLEHTLFLIGDKESNYESLQHDFLEILERKDANLTTLNESYNNLSQEYDELLDRYNTAKTLLTQLCDNFGATDGIFIVEYKYARGTVGFVWTYLSNMTFYNALPTAKVSVKVYGEGGTTKTFTYTILSGATINKVEGWTGGTYAQDYSYITVQNVERNW